MLKTKQTALTPQELEEKELVNRLFYDGDLSEVYFKTSAEIHNFVFDLCRSKGFIPCAKDKKTNSFVRYRCEFSGDPTPGAKSSKKTRCPFYLNTSLNKNGYHITSLDARHNHPFGPNNSSFFINPEIEREIQMLSNINIRPRQIADIMELKGLQIPSNIIAGIIYRERFSSIDDEYLSLHKYIVENNGICIPFDFIHQGQKTPLRCAIWTQTENEKMNLLQYGDIILFDSTDPKLRNGWLAIPVSVIDSNRHILSGGLCFLAFETEETISFLLSQIFTFDVAQKNEVIITDEDQSYRGPIS